MSFPDHLQISIDTVFSMFSQQDAQTLSHFDIGQLLSFVFAEMGITRPVDQDDIDSFLRQFQLQSQAPITKSHFVDQQFLSFNRNNLQNLANTGLVELKIPVQPFFEELKSISCQIIEKQKIREFLIGINSLLQVPKSVGDEDVQKFIADFDQNGDGELELKDLEGIECLRFKIRKCRRYS